MLVFWGVPYPAWSLVGSKQGFVVHLLGALGLSAPFMPFGFWVIARSPCVGGTCHKVKPISLNTPGSHFPLAPVLFGQQHSREGESHEPGAQVLGFETRSAPF